MALSHNIVRDPATLRLDSRNPLGQSDPVPTQVQNVQQTGSTSSSVTLSWDPASDATSYNVYVDSVDTPTLTGVTGTSATLTGLTAETPYDVRVSGVNDIGEGELSSAVTMNTNAAPVVPGDPGEGDLSVLKAFPGAEGSGALAVGGRGGQVIKVTNLNNAGAGSLRAACEASGPRVVVFEVAGTIVLTSSINISNPYITIAGQTAPGGGIQITFKEPGTIPMSDGCPFPPDQWDRYHGACTEGEPTGATWRTILNNQRPMVFEIVTHDVILRYLRTRPGYVGHCTSCPGQGIANTIRIGNMSALSSRHHVENVILDHVSVMWGSNVNLLIYDLTGERRVQNISVQNSIIAEMLYARNLMVVGSDVWTYPTAGALMGNIDMHRNFLSDSNGRQPLAPHGRGFSGDFRFINNISYNSRSTLARVNQDIEYNTKVDYVGNIFDRGPSFKETNWGCYEIGIARNTKGFQPTAYVAGNWGERHGYDNYSMLGFPSSGGGSDCGRPLAPVSYRRSVPTDSPPVPVTVVHVDDLEDHLLPDVGASHRIDPVNGGWVFNRDAADARVLLGFSDRSQANTFQPWHEEEVGGFPSLTGTPYQYDADGISAHWKSRNGVSGNIGATLVPGLNGWTYLDLFLAGLDLPGA